jgi:hypothetical protein
MVADARGLGVATLWRREVSELIAKDVRVGGGLSPDGEGTWGVRSSARLRTSLCSRQRISEGRATM